MIGDSDKDNINDWTEFFRRQWNDFSYTKSDGESLGVVQERNILEIKTILKECEGQTVAIGTHGCSLLTILNFYDKSYGYDEFLRILPILPFIICCDFLHGEIISIKEIEI